MADRENEKKYSAEMKGYTDKIYEVRFMPVLERSEYQAGPEREGLIKLQGIMEEKDFEKYINNGLIRITQDGDRLMMISKNDEGGVISPFLFSFVLDLYKIYINV